ncbi:hypothetical protein ABCR94_28145 [Streptomyces sp. 21So2-11]|uniref:hypothetical protein n=1 Tax=Streptomyces sp. 21So2-11 TaxID=3144408 RepID=UPI00321925C3
MTDTTTGAESKIARIITDWLEPKNWILAVTLLIGWHAGGWAGLLWGAEAALFAAIIPILYIKHGVKQGRWGDRHVGAKPARLLVMAVILSSVAVGIGLMVVGNAPQAMIALVASMLITLAVLMAITVVWKISVHQAVSAGASAMLVLTYGPWMLFAFALVVIVGWSRVELADHTRNQVIAGTILGTAVAAATFSLLR